MPKGNTFSLVKGQELLWGCLLWACSEGLGMCSVGAGSLLPEWSRGALHLQGKLLQSCLA